MARVKPALGLRESRLQDCCMSMCVLRGQWRRAAITAEITRSFQLLLISWLIAADRKEVPVAAEVWPPVLGLSWHLITSRYLLHSPLALAMLNWPHHTRAAAQHPILALFHTNVCRVKWLAFSVTSHCVSFKLMIIRIQLFSQIRIMS